MQNPVSSPKGSSNLEHVLDVELSKPLQGIVEGADWHPREDPFCPSQSPVAGSRQSKGVQRQVLAEMARPT